METSSFVIGFIVGDYRQLVKSSVITSFSELFYCNDSVETLLLWLIVFGTGSAVMGITLITPALPVIASTLDVSSQKVQRLLTFYLAMLAGGAVALWPLIRCLWASVFFYFWRLFDRGYQVSSLCLYLILSC